MKHYIIELYRTIRYTIQRIFAPIRCIVCSVGGSYVCKQHEKYLLGYPHCCTTCFQPTLYSQQCTLHRQSYVGVVIGFYYTRIIKNLIHKAKYGGSYHIFSYIATKLIVHIKTNPVLMRALQQGTLLVTHIPMHHRKEVYQRGYNQASILGQYIADELGVKHIALLQKPHYTFSQVTKTRTQRTKNTTLFTPIYTLIPQQYTILLVDDIFTTGTTMKQASDVLSEHFPTCSIRGLCIARNI